MIEIKLTIDPDQLRDVIKDAKKLDDNNALFTELAKVAAAKAEIEAALEQVVEVEAEAKALINERAKQSDTNWTIISGEGYTIRRQRTGAVYIVSDQSKAKEFVKVEVKPDTSKIKDYISTESKLPDGITANPDRGESITIKVEEQ